MKPVSIEYVAASTTATGEYEDDGVFRETSVATETKKMGHSLFGCCCDTRQGTFRSDRIIIISSIINLSVEQSVIIAIEAIDSNTTAADDSIEAIDNFVTDVGNDHLEDALQISMVLLILGILFACVSIYGAKVFKVGPVAANVAFLFIHALFYAVTAGNYLGLAMAILLMYPQIMFIVEVQKGIMSPMTYTQEAQYCCCIPKGSQRL